MSTLESWASSAVASPNMVIDSFDGPVTQNEINSFKSHIKTLTPAPDNFTMENSWVMHDSGEQVKAMALMYEITKDAIAKSVARKIQAC